MKLYHYIPKGCDALTKGIYSVLQLPEELLKYGKRLGTDDHKKILAWMEGTFEGRSRAISVLTEPVRWRGNDPMLKEWVDKMDLLEIDFDALSKDGLIESIWCKEGSDACGINENIREISADEIDCSPLSWHLCSKEKGLFFGAIRHYFLVMKDGMVPAKYIRKSNMLKVRPAKKNDALAIANINVLGWKKGYKGLLPDSILDAMEVSDKRIARIKETISNAEIYLAAEDESGVVGFLTGGKTRNKDLPYPYEIYIFYVHPDHWRGGIGTALIQAFKKKIKGADFCVYMLDGNKRALNFYQKMGGIRSPEFDCDAEINHVMTHDIFLGFKGEKEENK